MAWVNAVDRNRRSFHKRAILGIGLLLCPPLFSKQERKILELLQKDLFPPINPDGGSFEKYLGFIMHHPKVSTQSKTFLKKGLVWLDETSRNLFSRSYIDLEDEKRERVLQAVAKEQWGENFITMHLGFIFEALLGDPVYGINKNGYGWKWLDHTPGFPRPKKVYDGKI